MPINHFDDLLLHREYGRYESILQYLGLNEKLAKPQNYTVKFCKTIFFKYGFTKQIFSRKLNKLVCDLSISKTAAELLASRLKEKHCLQPSIHPTWPGSRIFILTCENKTNWAFVNCPWLVKVLKSSWISARILSDFIGRSQRSPNPHQKNTYIFLENISYA